MYHYCTITKPRRRSVSNRPKSRTQKEPSPLCLHLASCINNTDDHLRNHGLIRAGSGWRLSPVFDINPNPDTQAVRATSIFAETENTAALAALRANADAFDLTDEMAETLSARVASAIKSCAKYARQASISSNEQRTLLRILEG